VLSSLIWLAALQRLAKPTANLRYLCAMLLARVKNISLPCADDLRYARQSLKC